jgi:hypothetical protein
LDGFGGKRAAEVVTILRPSGAMRFAFEIALYQRL